MPSTAPPQYCNAPREPARTDRGYIFQTDSKNWQPRGGELTFVVKLNPDSRPSLNATVRVCFRWQQTAGADEFIEASARVASVENGNKVTVITTVPALKPAPPRWQWADANQPAGVYNLWLVPVADVRILMTQAAEPPRPDASGAGETAVIADVTTGIGITNAYISLFIALACVAVVFALLSLACRNRPQAMAPTGASLKKAGFVMRVVMTSDAAASLSQFQILLWTLVVGGSAIYVALLSGELINISTGTLVLLGIAGVSMVGSKIHDANEAKKADNAASSPATATPVTPATTTPPMAAPPPAATTPAAAATPATTPAVSATPPPSVAAAAAPTTGGPSWCDLVINNGEIDLARLQMLFFTVISAAFVTMKVLTSYVIPEIPENFVLLMGISNGVYLTSKFAGSR